MHQSVAMEVRYLDQEVEVQNLDGLVDQAAFQRLESGQHLY